MNVAFVKLLCWLGCAGLVFALSAYAYGFFQELPERQKPYDEDHIRAVLSESSVRAMRGPDFVDYEEVKRTFMDANWTGARAEVATGPAEPAGPPQPTFTPVAELLSVNMIRIDTDSPDESLAYVVYKGAGIAEKQGSLRVGDSLPPPHGSVKVAAIEIDRVEFAFEGGERENESVGLPDLGSEPVLVAVGADGARIPPRKTSSITVASRPEEWVPEKTQLIGHNRFRIGTEDAASFEQNYAEILTRDVRTRVWHDPETGRRAGVELLEVRPGSIVERHGGQTGDVLKSINGHPVSSQQEAIKFIKNHQDQYSVWYVVVENLGRERTIVFESPSE